MTKIEAIAHLELSFAHNKKFRKAWKDYIELSLLETSEQFGLESEMTKPKLEAFSEGILRLFDATWWEAQGLK